MATSLRWTVADLEALPQPLDDKSYEIIDSRQGVREYWLVDWRQRTVAVYRRREPALRHAATV